MVNALSIHPLLAVIPARGGSKGLLHKNILPFMGHPLIAHSILLARMCPEIDRVVVSTDSEEIASVARRYDADVISRPAELAQDTTPMWPVLKHALNEVEQRDGKQYENLMLLAPTNPSRLPSDVTEVIKRLLGTPEADGVICVSRPKFSPYWNSVIEKDGWMEDLFSEAHAFNRRQDLPTVFEINGMLYLWRRNFVVTTQNWRPGHLLMYEVPGNRVIDIDEQNDLSKAELLAQNGLLQFPWLA